MKFSGLASWTFLITCASAFQVQLSPLAIARRATTKLAYSLATVVDIAEDSPRDIMTMDEWATSCGVQRAEVFQLVSEDGVDVSVITNQDLSAGSPILYVPSEIILTGNKARQELGVDAYSAEQKLITSKASDRIQQFYLFLKILKEYELGEQSPWYPWLNSLPRYYSNGASMTDFCFGCLPPFAAKLAMKEKVRLSQFFQSLKEVPFLNSETKKNIDLAKWAFAVVHTRYFDTPDGDICVVPMADMFNHGTETEADISYDEEGNCYAYATCDVPAGYPLRISYGDPTNPSNLLARYGFLDQSSPATFCKIMIENPSPELKNMGYDHSRMVFYKETGEASEEVWDVMLYQALEGSPDQQVFHDAHMTGDFVTKQNYHQQYFPQTLAALQKHVDEFLAELDELSECSRDRDIELHPRLPLIMSHNDFVRNAFLKVKANLDNMR